MINDNILSLPFPSRYVWIKACMHEYEQRRKERTTKEVSFFPLGLLAGLPLCYYHQLSHRVILPAR